MGVERGLGVEGVDLTKGKGISFMGKGFVKGHGYDCWTEYSHSIIAANLLMDSCWLDRHTWRKHTESVERELVYFLFIFYFLFVCLFVVVVVGC